MNPLVTTSLRHWTHGCRNDGEQDDYKTRDHGRMGWPDGSDRDALIDLFGKVKIEWTLMFSIF